ncbi:uncharacterized protein (DUF2235 family) [Actimicrobium sp. GrIS 1.19]|uniref:DUF2235 domain-containing protein n=1 Tax=Actimicrobium sp. GrIS 1.19 TaxID=3071708 RepID=UPI002DFB31C8|nr:uncharacterized protein (DUF2235 family) [Actimicrobium sp. GrIS 1.19]
MKRILVFSDGTGNSSGKAQKTNVWRLFQAVDQALPDQLAKYDDGVGTSSNKYLAALGGVFGYGLKRNVIDLYKFICRNHEDGDEIHGFGFSRGAFTIRILVGLIVNQGLVPFGSEQELHANAVLAYRRFRDERFRSWSPLVWLGRRLRDALLYPFNRTASSALKGARKGVPVRFLGLWDSVGAYGMPVDELKWGISLLLWPMLTADRKLSPQVERACHALSLDDQRQTFHPILFDESDERSSDDGLIQKRISQVWFAGVHSNVGGGYPEDKLSLVSFDWMVSQLVRTGVRMDTAALLSLGGDRSAFARIYDSRAGLASYYRYGPRSLDMGVGSDQKPILPVVHGSAVMRMAHGSDAYAPISLPSTFNVLAPDGSLLPMHGFADVDRTLVLQDAGPATATGDAAARTAALKAAIASLNPPGEPVDDEMVRQVHDTIWWRRVMYFACLFSTLSVVAFPYAAGFYARAGTALLSALPWIGGALLATLADWSARFTPVWQGLTGGLFALAANWVPAWTHPWLQALQNRPFAMLCALALVAITFAAGQGLAQRIHDRSRYAWHRASRIDYLDWAVRSARSGLATALVVLIGLALLTVLVALTRGRDSPLLVALLLPDVLMIAAVAWRRVILVRVRRDRDALKEGGQALPLTPTLSLARFLRCNAFLVRLHALVANRIIPLLFAAALAWAIVELVVLVVRQAIRAGVTF